MATIKEKHPSWFKMKLEHKELLNRLPPETVVNVLLDCMYYLETREEPDIATDLEDAALAAFLPNLEEAWEKYLQRIHARDQ